MYVHRTGYFRLIDGRAVQQRRRRILLWLTLAAFPLLAGCANEGIWPRDPLPPAPAGPQLPYPSFQSRDTASDDQRGVLTPIEVEELEAKLAKQAVTRQKGVEKRIQSSPKAK
jgi:hypothetical protein